MERQAELVYDVSCQNQILITEKHSKQLWAHFIRIMHSIDEHCKITISLSSGQVISLKTAIAYYIMNSHMHY